MSEDGAPGRAINRGESRPGSEQVPPEVTKVSAALTTRSFPEATNDFLRCQIGRMVSKRHGPVFCLILVRGQMMSTILQKKLLSAARERQLAEILESSPLDWHFAELLSHPLQNIRDLRPPVSVVVSMREIDRIQQQPIPTYRPLTLRRYIAGPNLSSHF